MWTSACQTRPVPASTSAGQPASSSTSQPPVQTQSQPGLCLTLKSGATQQPLPTTKLVIYPSYATKTPVLQRFLLGKPEDYCLQPPATSSSSPYLHTCILLGASPFSRMFLTLVHPLHQSSQFQLQQFHQQQSHADKSKETEII